MMFKYDFFISTVTCCLMNCFWGYVFSLSWDWVVFFKILHTLVWSFFSCFGLAAKVDPIFASLLRNTAQHFASITLEWPSWYRWYSRFYFLDYFFILCSSLWCVEICKSISSKMSCLYDCDEIMLFGRRWTLYLWLWWLWDHLKTCYLRVGHALGF